MPYLLAVVLPPVAVLRTGRISATLINLLLTACLWIPGVVHAWAVVRAHEAEQRDRAYRQRVRDLTRPRRSPPPTEPPAGNDSAHL